MAENKDVMTPDEESNVEEINKFVTGEDADEVSEETDVKEAEKKPVAPTEDEKAAEKKPEKREMKPAHKKIAHRPHDTPHEPVAQKKEMNKKSEPKHDHKKTEQKSEHKAPIVHKRLFSRKDRNEKNVKESLKSKKTSGPVKDTKTSQKRKDSKNILLWIGIGLLAVILIVALIMLFWPNKQQPTSDNQTINTVAATVNGEAIYLQDVQEQYNNLNPVLQQLYSVESLLNKSIDDLLLFQESKKAGISITKETIQKELEAVMTENGLTENQLEEALAKQGMTVDDLKETIEKSMSIRELLNRTILQNITITENQIKNYYDLNTEEFEVPARVTVRHILILTSPKVSNETAKDKIEQIEGMLNATNFCELAKEYSEDPGSKDNCGEYTFAKGDFNNPEFENPSFDLKINETAIIHTDFGYHLIKKIASLKAGTMDLSEVHDDIKDKLYSQVAQNKFDAMLEGLRNNSVIVNYYLKTETTNSTNVVPQNNLDGFAKCITEKNATLYGAYWCPHCENQKEMFGDSLKYVSYVECAVEGKPQVQTEACTKAEISGYPTWIINGKQYPGEQTLERLAQLTGCSLT